MTAVTTFKPDPKYTTVASDAIIERTKKALEANGFEVFIAENGA